MANSGDTLLLAILAFIFPPAAVAFVSGCGIDLCFNILLCLLGYLPGCIHALWIVLKRSEAIERYGYGNWTYKGMGEYGPYDPNAVGTYARGSAPQGAPPPASEPAPAPGSTQGQPAGDQKYAPPPGPQGTTPGSAAVRVDEKKIGGGENVPQPAADQKYGYQPPPGPPPQQQQTPADPNIPGTSPTGGA